LGGGAFRSHGNVSYDDAGAFATPVVIDGQPNIAPSAPGMLGRSLNVPPPGIIRLWLP